MHILAVDPGTSHTGVVKAEIQEDSIIKILDWGELEIPKGVPAPKRINAIVSQVYDWATRKPAVREIWVEQFAAYGARRGMMWNMALVGALLYLPATRENEDLTSYTVHPKTWKSWYAKDFKNKTATPHDILKRQLEDYGLFEEDLYLDCIRSQHIADALGLALFAVYGDHDVDQTSPA